MGLNNDRLCESQSPEAETLRGRNCINMINHFCTITLFISFLTSNLYSQRNKKSNHLLIKSNVIQYLGFIPNSKSFDYLYLVKHDFINTSNYGIEFYESNQNWANSLYCSEGFIIKDVNFVTPSNYTIKRELAPNTKITRITVILIPKTKHDIVKRDGIKYEYSWMKSSFRPVAKIDSLDNEVVTSLISGEQFR